MTLRRILRLASDKMWAANALTLIVNRPSKR